MRIRVCVLCLVVAWCASAAAAPLQTPAAQAAGTIEGRVIDGASGDPLPGAKVIVTGSAAETSTDREGFYRLSGVAAGDQTVVVTYLGRKDAVLPATVTAGATRKVDVTMG